MVNSDWFEGKESANPKISVQTIERIPVDFKIEEVEDIKILSVQEHHSPFMSTKPPSGAFA